MKKVIPIWEKIFVLLALILSTGAKLGTFSSAGAGDENVDISEGDFTSQVLWVLIYAITFFLLLQKVKSWKPIIGNNKVLFCLLSLIALSFAWSDYPLITIRRSVALIGTAFFGVYLANRFDLFSLLEIACKAFFVTAILSALVAILLPQYGIMHGLHEGAWRGVLEHKNGLGRAMVTSVAIAFTLWKQKKKRIYIIQIIFSIILIILSKSTTALLSVIAILGFAYFIKVLKLSFSGMIISFLILICIGIPLTSYLIENYASTMISLGKDPTLTGRTILWAQLLDMISKRPVLGYGYSAFWLGDMGPSKMIWAMVGWEPTQAHNGYINITLDIGCLGLLFYLIVFFSNFFFFLKNYSINKTTAYLWGIMYFIFLLIYNFSENVAIRQNSIFSILFVFTIVSYSTFNPSNGRLLKLKRYNK